ncbi:MAG: GatB/YqeY domain-containing protein [Gammaproteobacteria bacterium]
MQERIRRALKSGARDEAAVLRLLLAEVRNKEIQNGGALDDAAFAGVVEKMIKQRRESVGHFERGGRDEMAKAERAEIEILAVFLPEPLSEAQLQKAVDDAIGATGAETARDIGRVMAALKNTPGADMTAAAKLVKAKLQP